MRYTKIYSHIIVYQKCKMTSIKEGCATRSLYASSGRKCEGVPINNQRGRGSEPCHTNSDTHCSLNINNSVLKA